MVEITGTALVERHSLVPSKRTGYKIELKLLVNILNRIPNQPSKHDVSRLLLNRFNSLSRVLRASQTELCQEAGLIAASARELVQTGRLLQAISWSRVTNKPVLSNFSAVVKYCRGILVGERKEQFHVIFLNKAMHAITHECLQIGTVDHVTVYPRELMARALHHGASGMILVHNHPSQNARPSDGDLTMTRQIIQISDMIGITVTDHIIISEEGIFSFRLEGLM